MERLRLAGSAVLVASYALAAGYLLLRSARWPLIHDAPLMHYIAWRIGEGAVPYRDLFDMNFPGTYLLHLFALRAFGDGDAGWRAFDLTWLGVTAVAIAALAARWGWVAAAGSACFFAVYHLSGGPAMTGQRDFLLSAFLVLGALGVARWSEGRSAWSLAVAGLSVGAAMVIKPHVALLAAGFAAIIVVGARRTGRSVSGSLTFFAIGIAALPVLVTGWLAAVGALASWRDILVHYVVPYYSRLARPPSWAFYRWQIWIPIIATVALSLATAIHGGRVTLRHGLAVLGAAYGIVHYFGQGKGWEYHLYPLAAFAAVLAFSEVAVLLRERVAPAVALIGSLGLALTLIGQKGLGEANPGWVAEKERVVAALTRDLGVLRTGDSVQVLDTTGGGIHALFRLRARQATRFLYDFHFFHDETTPEIRALRDEFVRDLTARPPRYIVLFEHGWPGLPSQRIASFPELARRLMDSYTLAALRPEYVIYAKRHGS